MKRLDASVAQCVVYLDRAAGRSQTLVSMWDTWQQLCGETEVFTALIGVPVCV